MAGFRVWRRCFDVSGFLALAACISFCQISQPATTAAKSEAPVRSGTFRVGNGVSAPVVISAPDPNYPLGSEIEGTVVLSIVVGTDGLVHDVRVVRSLAPDFDANAAAAVKKWKFKPAQKAGKNVAVEVNVEVSFER